MTSTESLIGQPWYAAIPGLVLAALSYLLIARLLIEMLFRNRAVILPFRIVQAVTGPFVQAVGAITPRVMPGPLVTVCTLVWVFALRIALVQVVAALTMRRMLG
jgi:hypothetical protein